MTHIVPLFATQSVNHPSVILLALNQKTLFAMLNVKNLNVKLNAQTRDVKCSTVQNVLLYAKPHIALLTVKLPNLNVKLFAKNQNVTGNATNQTVPNLNVNWFAKTPTVFLKLNAVLVTWEDLELLVLSHSLKKLKIINNVVHAIKTKISLKF
jgi:hypothetical protein